MEATLSQGEHWSSDNHTSTPTSLFHASVQLHPDTATSSLYVSPTYTLATLIPSGFSPSAASDSSFAFQTLFAPFPRLHSSWQLPMNARSKRHQRRRGSMALTMLRWRRSQYPGQGVRRHGNGRESTSSMQGVGECMHKQDPAVMMMRITTAFRARRGRRYVVIRKGGVLGWGRGRRNM